jgi:hypothetical protein
MKKLHFAVTIGAPRPQVWDTMLGPETYKAWTAPFCEGSYFEGSWVKGGKIRFLAPYGSGMTSVIADNRMHEYISIRHLGYVRDGVDDTESEDVRSWTPAFENYTFRDVAGGTQVDVDADVAPEFEQFMLETYPQALAKLKAICEER